MREKNVFFRLSRDDENAITELLCNLMQYKVVKKAVLQFIGIEQDSIESIQFEHINTQQKISNNMQPDIIIENDSCCIFIENKIHRNTSIADSQINDYKQELEKKQQAYKKLIFLLPSGHKDMNEIENKKFEVIYWEDLIHKFYELGLNELNPLLKNALDYLKNILGFIDSTHFTIGEVVIMNNIRDLYEAHSVFEKQKTIFKEVHSKLKEDKDFTIFQDAKPPKYEIEDVYRGCYLADNVFLGHSFLNDEAFSFSLAIYEEAISEEVIHIAQAENGLVDKKVFSLKGNSQIQFNIDNERCYYFKLDKYWVEEGDVIQRLYDECKEILKLVLKDKKDA